MFSNWRAFLDEERRQPYFVELQNFLAYERSVHNILPPEENTFAAFDACPLGNTKVIIVGQDPYHGPGQAHGLAFSVSAGVAIPPSLRNIFLERSNDLSLPPPAHGNLTAWAQQGILLLNSVLTVREGEAHSHRNQGWETFTDHVIAYLNTHKTSCVFVLWGSHAQQKMRLIDASRHHIVTAPHPSPLSAHRGFLGSRPFSSINSYLAHTGQEAINWDLPPVASSDDDHSDTSRNSE
jgi:uracil-DNA glycosylase